MTDPRHDPAHHRALAEHAAAIRSIDEQIAEARRQIEDASRRLQRVIRAYEERMEVPRRDP